jgi:RHS repeat-associated protein
VLQRSWFCALAFDHRGDYYFRMRTYIPEWGMFTGPDMRIDVMEENGACNYLFALNNPLVYVDPTWLFAMNELSHVQRWEYIMAAFESGEREFFYNAFMKNDFRRPAPFAGRTRQDKIAQLDAVMKHLAKNKEIEHY